VEVLTGSSIPKRYWSCRKRKLAKEGYFELYEKIVQLKFVAADGKFYSTDCADNRHVVEVSDMGLIIYIGGFPSPSKARVFKMLDVVLPKTVDFYHWGDLDLGGTKDYCPVKKFRIPRSHSSPNVSEDFRNIR
jgi:hypothetical protein